MSADARLFVAVDLPASTRAELVRWTRWALEPGEAPSGGGGRGAGSSTRGGRGGPARGPIGRGEPSRAGGARAEPFSPRARPGRAPGDGVRRVEARALHVTLCFLGDQPLDAVEEIAEVVERAVGGLASADRSAGGVAGGVGSVGPLAVGAPVWLPPRKPRALALEIHDESGGLAALYEGLRDGLGAAIGWKPERRRFRPHVTVARLRSWAPPPACVQPTPPLVFEAESVTVYRSRLEPDGATYDALVRVALADGSAVHDD